jgi:acyl carrier protein
MSEHGANVEAQVREIIATVAKQDLSAIGRDADLVEALGVDSLQGLQVLAAVEKRFRIRLPDEELVRMRTIGIIADTVSRLGQDAGGAR